MHFMLIILAFVLSVVVWGFFHSNPAGVPRARLTAVNVVVLLGAGITGIAVGDILYADAIVVKAGEKGLAAYLAIMAGGTAFLIVVAAGGLLRYLVIFAPSRRSEQRPAADA
jgi:hypothetical protein